MSEAGLRILVIEDHPALGRFIAAALSQAGWSVRGPLSDHAAAMEAAQAAPADLAVMDRVLRGADTLPIADVLAERGIRVLLISGFARSSLPERFWSTPFLEKPFTIDALVEAVRAIAAQAD